MTLLRLENVGYTDESFQVLKHINWELHSSGLYQIIGANASGKTALLRLIAGLNPMTSGTMYWKGEAAHFSGPLDAARCGIVYLQEEPQLFQNETVAENIVAVSRLNCGGIRFVSRRRDLETCQRLLSQFGLHFSAQTPVSQLTIAEMRIVELLRVYHSGASLLLMDALAGWIDKKEYGKIVQILVALREKYGTSAIVCASSIDHILRDADSILYLKYGRQVACLSREKQDIQQLPAEFRSEHLEYPKLELPPGKPLLQLKNFGVFRSGRRDSAAPADYLLCEREIVGFYGVDAPCCEAFCRIITGRQRDGGGELLLNGLPVQIQSPRHALRLGLACQSVNKGDALFRNLSLQMNLVPPASVGPQSFPRPQRAGRLNASMQAKRLHLQEQDVEARCERLSSATQQKVLLGRYLAQEARIFVLFHPTHGMDNPSKLDIYNLLTHLQQRGCGIMLFSNDLDELAYMCDRIYVTQEDEILQITGDSASRSAQLYHYIATYDR